MSADVPSAAHDPAGYAAWVAGFSARPESILVSFDPRVTLVTTGMDMPTPMRKRWPNGWRSQSISKRGKCA